MISGAKCSGYRFNRFWRGKSGCIFLYVVNWYRGDEHRLIGQRYTVVCNAIRACGPLHIEEFLPVPFASALAITPVNGPLFHSSATNHRPHSQSIVLNVSNIYMSQTGTKDNSRFRASGLLHELGRKQQGSIVQLNHTPSYGGCKMLGAICEHRKGALARYQTVCVRNCTSRPWLFTAWA